MLCALLLHTAPGVLADPAIANSPGACAARLATLTSTPGESLPSPLTLLSWNIHKGSDPGWREDLRSLGSLADIVFLQEARPQTGMLELLTHLEHRKFTRGFYLGSSATGVATLSLRPALLHCGLSLREPWLGTRKAVTVTAYAVGGAPPLLAVNIHGINVSIGTRMFARQLELLAPILAAHSGAVMLGGDVNAWSEARLAVLNRLAARYGLRRVIFDPDLRTRIIGLPMDYIYTRGLAVQRARAIAVSSSDHNPLLLELAFPDALLP